MKIRILFLAMFAVAVTSCGEKKTPAHTHDYSCSTVKEATCTKEGEKECTCSICGDKITRVIQIEDHTPESCIQKVAPKCSEAGKEECTCAVCGAKVEQDIPATGHIYEDGKCNVCGAAKYGYKVVAANSLNIREEPSVSSSRVGEVSKGKTLLIIEIEENGEEVQGNTQWIKISFQADGKKVYGWVSCAYLTDPVG